jgi:hypothetical protein
MYRDELGQMRRALSTIALALLLSGCASWYQPRIQKFSLRGGDVNGPGISAHNLTNNATPLTLTTFESWTSLWSAVCGGIVTDGSGKLVAQFSGSCGTPLTLLLGSPVNVGLGAAVAAGGL